VRGRGKRYPDALRVRVTAWARKRRASGATFGAIGAELGLSSETVRRWTSGSAIATDVSSVLVPVEVVPDRLSPDRASPLVTVVSPTGFRLEGLSLQDAITVLARLR
jgi:hypothetical protein